MAVLPFTILGNSNPAAKNPVSALVQRHGVCTYDRRHNGRKQSTPALLKGAAYRVFLI
ncbi:MAG: hypothetical protein PVG26_23945 [Desulfobacterales bacterium]